MDGTPRGTKRFRNKARFFGTLLAIRLRDKSAANVRPHTAALVALDLVDKAELTSSPLSQMSSDALAVYAENALQSGDRSGTSPIIGACIAEHFKTFGAIDPGLAEEFRAWSSLIEVR